MNVETLLPAAVPLAVLVVGLWRISVVERRLDERADYVVLAKVESEYDLYDQDAEDVVAQINAAQFNRRELTPAEWVEAAERVRVHVLRSGRARGSGSVRRGR